MLIIKIIYLDTSRLDLQSELIETHTNAKKSSHLSNLSNQTVTNNSNSKKSGKFSVKRKSPKNSSIGNPSNDQLTRDGSTNKYKKQRRNPDQITNIDSKKQRDCPIQTRSADVNPEVCPDSTSVTSIGSKKQKNHPIQSRSASIMNINPEVRP